MEEDVARLMMTISNSEQERREIGCSGKKSQLMYVEVGWVGK